MVTVALEAMNRSDEIVYNALKSGPMTKQQIADTTRYSVVNISRILTRLQTQNHIRAYRLPRRKPTFYEILRHDELYRLHSTTGPR